MKKDDEVVTTCLGCLVGLLAIPFSMAWKGYVLSILWAWFIVPQFALKPLTIPMAIGISIVMSMLSKDNPTKPDDNKDDKRSAAEKMMFAIVMAFSIPAFMLLLGYIVKQFIP